MSTYQPTSPTARMAAVALALLAVATCVTFDPYLVIVFGLAQVLALWLAFGFIARLIRALAGAKPGFRTPTLESRAVKDQSARA